MNLIEDLEELEERNLKTCKMGDGKWKMYRKVAVNLKIIQDSKYRNSAVFKIINS